MQLWDLLWFEWQFFLLCCCRQCSIIFFSLLCFSFAIKISRWNEKFGNNTERNGTKKKITKKDTDKIERKGESMRYIPYTHCPRSIIFFWKNSIKTLLPFAVSFVLLLLRISYILVKFYRQNILQCIRCSGSFGEHEYGLCCSKCSTLECVNKQKPFSNERITAKIIRSFEVRASERASASEKKMEIKPNITSA